MSQTGYTPILIYASGTATNVPLAANLTSSASGAELALNYFDGKLYYKDNAGVVQLLASKAGASGSVTSVDVSGGTTGLTTSGGPVTTSGTITLAGTLITSNGGTGLSSYTAGDIAYYASGTALSKLGIGSSNTILTSSGSAPQWTAGSSITVGIATNLAGGSGGSVPYQSSANTTTFLSIGTANTVMTSSGSAPQWSTSITLSGSATASGFIPSGSSAPTNGLFLPTTNTVGISTNSTEAARWDANGNYLLGGTAARGTTAGTKHLDLFNGTAPAGTLTNGISLYSSSGDFMFMDALGGGYKVGFRNVPPVGTKTTSYTLATTDVGKYVQVGSSGSIVIPDATFSEGDVISVFNNTSSSATITCTITTAYISGTDTDKATMTLATRGVATILFISGTVCVVSGSVT